MQRGTLRIVNIQLLQKRFYKKQDVRVRFAPSPTGHLHLGGLRTALYNYLFARANNGSFILRIEDTDQSRVEPQAVEKLQDDLFWAGIISDEDPVRGGPVGPYIQSQRLELYKEQASKLLDNGSAYHCFCTEQRLDLLRQEALRSRQMPKYDNRCRELSSEDVKAKMNNGEPYCLRFKLSSEPQSFHDEIYGLIASTSAQHEGDFVIVKADGYPTYHFANVVDDHFMNISHVLRGVEWQISTPKHIQLYKAFGWQPPQYGHLPLILNADGSKLSKRQGHIRVEAYRKQGIFPLALLNFITHAGGGFDRNPGMRKCFTYEDLIKQFDINRINTNSTKLAPEILLEFNGLEICRLLEDTGNHKFLADRVRSLVVQAFPDHINDGSLQLDDDHVIGTLKWAQHRIKKLDDLINRELAFLWVVPTSLPSTENQRCLESVKIVCERMENFDDFQTESLKKCLREIAKNNGIPYANFMKILRGVLSGLEDGPPVVDMMTILGKDKTIFRLKRALSSIQWI